MNYFTCESWSANASLNWMADKVGILALAGSIAVLSPVTFRAKLFTSCSSETWLAFAPSVHGIAGGIVVAVALMRATGPKSAYRAGHVTFRPMPSSWTSTLTIHVVTLQTKKKLEICMHLFFIPKVFLERLLHSRLIA